jgi:hypothetical protein
MCSLGGSLCFLVAVSYYASNFPRPDASSYGYSFALTIVAFVLSLVSGFAYCPVARPQGQTITAWV